MPETAHAGLFAHGKPIPLRGVAIEAEVRDFCSRVTVIQRYQNLEENPIEAMYVFPLDERAAVCGFAALVDGVEIVGEVKEREEAFERYDDALSEGHGAFLLDQERSDVFTARIGNLLPGKEAIVRITYVAELGLEGEDLRFVLPTTISPRYAPLEDRKGIGRPPAEVLNPPVAWEVPYGLELTVRLEMPSSIRGLESPSHPLAIEIDGASATVRLGERRTELDRDFVLLVKLQEPHQPRAWLEERKGETVAMLAFQPRFETRESPAEVIFVVDRSGSMGGSSIAEARNALQLCLRSLREGSRFNIVGFGSTHQKLFPESRPFGDESLRIATEHVRSLEANLGGTEILPALESVLGSGSASLPRQLIVMTDGQVTNTDAVLALVRKHSETTRVFTLGIGAGASHDLVRGMARAGRGEAEMIFPGERVEAKVLRQLARALAPALHDVRVSWGGLEVRQAPNRVPPVFAGGRVLVYGFLEKPLERDVEVKLGVRIAEEHLSFPIELSPLRRKAGTLVATLAARALLRDMEDGLEKEAAIAVSIKYGLSSKWASFVAVEARENGVLREIELRRVPVALTRGWGGLAVGASADAFVRSSRVATTAVSQVLALDADRLHPVRPLDELVQLQRADGSWDLDRALASVLGIRLRKLEKKLKGATGSSEEAARAWATALALAWLEANAADSRDEWEILADKARAWLSRCGASLASGEDWLAAAAPALTARGFWP